MDQELQVLNHIENNENITQRDIAKNTGMSLGTVNILIKRLVKKGLLKIERLNPRTIRYILTPTGFKEKAEATYRYVLSSYKYIKEVDSRMDNLLTHILNKGYRQVSFFGEPDEVFELLKNKLNSMKMECECIQNVEDLRNGNMLSDASVVFAWQPENIEVLNKNNIRYIHLFGKL